MLLQRLKEYAEERMRLPPTLYAETPIRYVIDVDSNGKLLNPEPRDTADPANRSTKFGVRRAAPQVQRAVGIVPLLLADNAEYTLGLAREGGRPQRVADCHTQYLRQLSECARATRLASVQGVSAFLHGSPLEQLQLPDDFDRGAKITFRVFEGFEGTLPIDAIEVQRFWAQINDPESRSAVHMQCIVCGEDRPVLSRLQTKVKGIPARQTRDTSIISANSDAFESYGLEASLIAPTCADCGEKFTRAINHLLADENARVLVRSVAAYICWTRKPVTFSLRRAVAEPDAEIVKYLLETPTSGKSLPEFDETRFYAIVLAASGGRAVVRDWLETTVGEAQQNLRHWFEMQRIVGAAGEEWRPLGVFALGMATVRDAKDLEPQALDSLFRCALTDTPLSPGLLYQVIRRCRAEQGVTRQQATLIKMVLLSRFVELKEGQMVDLEQDFEDPAYQCGRLLSVLEAAQRRAIPGINATIVDRYYGTASSTPALVFPRLLRGAQPHLSKLKGSPSTRPAGTALDQRIEEILRNVRRLPIRLTLEAQGLFALGYYHQRARDRGRARALASERSGLASDSNGGEDESAATEDA